MLVIKESDKNAAELACQFLCLGKIIFFATDTVYGIAADATNFKAVEALYKIKNRNQKKPVAVFVKNLQAAKSIFLFDDLAKKIAEKFLPGKLTLVLKTKSKNLSNLASNLNQNDDGFLGFRIVERDFIKNLLEKFDGILAVSSANISSKKAATDASEVKKYFANLTSLDLAHDFTLLIDGGECQEKLASTVVKIFDNKLTILRNGAIDQSLLLDNSNL